MSKEKSTNPYNLATKLLEQENKEKIARDQAIQKVIQDIEESFIKNNFTIKDWDMIATHFSQMFNKVVPTISIKSIKDKYLQL